MSNNLVRDLFELLIVVAVGGTMVSAIQRLRRGQVSMFRCPTCDKPSSRAYPKCPRCGAPQGQAS